MRELAITRLWKIKRHISVGKEYNKSSKRQKQVYTFVVAVGNL